MYGIEVQGLFVLKNLPFLGCMDVDMRVLVICRGWISQMPSCCKALYNCCRILIAINNIDIDQPTRSNKFPKKKLMICSFSIHHFFRIIPNPLQNPYHHTLQIPPISSNYHSEDFDANFYLTEARCFLRKRWYQVSISTDWRQLSVVCGISSRTKNGSVAKILKHGEYE